MDELEIRGLRPGEETEMDALLAREGLRRDPWLDYAAGIFDGGTLVAGGGCAGVPAAAFFSPAARPRPRSATRSRAPATLR